MSKIFEKCPICGENAIVEPKLGTKEYRVFRCTNEHLFKKRRNHKIDQKNSREYLPEWARIIKDISKGRNGFI